MSLRFCIVFFLIFLNLCAGAQDPVFSQPYNTKLIFNPAFAGTSEMSRIMLAYRNQWPKMGSAYVTYNASYDQYLPALEGGLGLNIVHDVQGDGTLSLLNIDAIYSYEMEVNPVFNVNAGFQTSWAQKRLNADDLIFSGDLDPATGQVIYDTEPIAGMRTGYIDFAVGFLAYSRKLYGGVSAHHIARPVNSFTRDYLTRIHRRYTFHAGAFLPVYEKRFGREAIRINPDLMYIHQSIYRQLSYGFRIFRKNYYGGFWVRQNPGFSFSSFIVTLGYSGDRFTIGYSHDFNISRPRIMIPGTGAHEVTLTLNFEYKGTRKRQRAIKCPKI